LLIFPKMSLSIPQSQLSNGVHNFEHVVKNTFVHFNIAPRKLRRCNTAPPELTASEDNLVESSEEDIASCTDSSQECFSACDADSGTSTPDCFSPRGQQKYASFSSPTPIMQMPMLSPAVPIACPSAMCGTTATSQNQDVFTITLLRAEGVSLGLDLVDEGNSLRVAGVDRHGAVEAWNRQCQTFNRQILPGDEIFAVNSARDPASMRQESSQKMLLKLSGRRGPMHFEEFHQWVPQFIPVMVMSPGFIPQPLAGKVTSIAESLISPDSAVQGLQSLANEGQEVCHHVWRPDPRKFSGKHPKVTKTESLSLGEFTFTIHAQAVSQLRGGSSFQASDGRGTVHVKCISEKLGTRTVTVTVGGKSDTVRQNFSTDSICKIPMVFDFKPESDRNGEIAVAFDFL